MSLKSSRHFFIVHPDFEEVTSLTLQSPHTLVKFGLVYHALLCLRIHGKHVCIPPIMRFIPLRVRILQVLFYYLDGKLVIQRCIGST